MASQFRVFYVYGSSDAEGEEELNLFLRQRRVVNVARCYSEDQNGSFWTFCVEYISGVPVESSAGQGSGAKPRIDYRKELSDEDFQVFAALREWRNARSVATAAPAYTLFTNEQIAEIAKRRPKTIAELGKIAGIGQGKSASYGADVIAIVEKFPRSETTTDSYEASATETEPSCDASAI